MLKNELQAEGIIDTMSKFASEISEKCNGCETYKNICPVNNITMVKDKPQFQHKCEQCFVCIHWCPQESIQIGNRTTNRKRYKNPKVKLGDFFDKKLF
jgi:MinD superfamily P-loop ATPase